MVGPVAATRYSWLKSRQASFVALNVEPEEDDEEEVDDTKEIQVDAVFLSANLVHLTSE